MDAIGACISGRRASSSFWRSAEDVAFSASSRAREEDYESLRWAALEKLSDIQNSSYEEINENDRANCLSPREKGGFCERPGGAADEEDDDEFLLKLKDRIDRAGIDLPTIEVRYEHLRVEAKAYVGSRSLPSFFNAILNTFEMITNYIHIMPSKRIPFTILHDVSGIIKPGRMTLLLGQPSSGKTTFLLALAGKLSSDLKVSGAVTYNGHAMDEFVQERTAAYVSQEDLHIGNMTVRETISFSARCQGVGSRYHILAELLRKEQTALMGGTETEIITDYIIKILGLDICADTLVGDQMLRGISGGQKKRMTTGEMIVGPSKVLLMDEISTGLDSSTTFQIMNKLKQIVHIMEETAVVSLLQPAPETYELFDDIILLSEGYIVYQGPRNDVIPFFDFMGFGCPKRKGVADFLQEVTSRKDQQQYWIKDDESHRYIPAKEFAEAFQSYHVGEKLQKELFIPFDKSKSHSDALTTSKYGMSKMELLKTCAEREILLMKRNFFVYAFRILQITIMSLVTMTVFWRANTEHSSINEGYIYLGALYFSNVIIMFNCFSDIAMTVLELPIFFKQRDNLFYPSWAYAIPKWMVSIPFSFIEVAVWVIISYYAIGFEKNDARFLKHYLLLFLINQIASGLYRFLAVVARILVIGNALAGYALLFSIASSGFLLAYGDMKKWWRWVYWVSPITYAQNSISINEFLGKSWNKIIPGTNQTLGLSILKSRAMFSEVKWYWIGAAAMFGYVLLCNLLYTIGLSYIKPIARSQPTISHERDKQIKGKGKYVSPLGGKSSISFSEPRNGGQIMTNDAKKENEGKRIMLPLIPLYITFDNIRYSVDMPKEMKSKGVGDRLILLNGLSGCFRPGVLTALMGATGAGKTTLMDILAGRKTTGYIEGNITISGYPKNQDTFARVSGYCEQNDIHSPYITVYESLVYSAWLRLSVEVDHVTQKMFIEEVMELVEMTTIKESLVGLHGVDGLSNEQRKRLTIAVELVANPSIIFMDEPTTGLDARSAAIVMRAIRNTADTGRTVVCTIHQPSIDIFEAFDELFLMRRGGEEIYVGPIGHNSAHLIQYFQGIKGVDMIKDCYNPATWMLEVTTQAEEQKLGIDFCEAYKNSELYRKKMLFIAEQSKPPIDTKDLCFPTKYSQSFVTQCIACLWKQNLSYWRDTNYTVVRFFYSVLIAFIIGTMFWGLGGKMEKQQDLLNAMGSMYAAILFLGLAYCSAVQPVVSTERVIFYRERAAGMYSSFPYAFGQVMIEQPYILAQSLVYGIIVYSMMGFEANASKFLWYIFFTYFTLAYFTCYGILAVGITPNLIMATIAATSFTGIWNLFSGFIIPRTEIPIWWRWYYWACPVSWSLYGMFVSQYGDVDDLLETGQSVAGFLSSNFGFRREFLGVVAVMVALFAVLYALSFGVAIRLLNFQKR